MAKTVSITISANDNFSAVFQKYQSAVGEASQQNDRVASTTGNAATAMDNLGGKIQGAIVAYAGMKGIQLVGDMFDLGQKVNVTSSTFDALTSKIGGAQLNMEALRKSTGGIVDDLTLMTGANKLLQMGLATNTDEMSRLSEMAIKLGSSMGMDAQKSMSDFSLLLANNSILRLDQFGISSSNVRSRMNELKDTMEGIDKNEAFKLAVLEEGQAALERLGDAATAAETPLNRLQTRLQNIAEHFAGNFAEGANSIAGIIEIATGQNPIQVAQKQRDEKQQQDFSGYYGTMFQQQAAGAGVDLTALFGSQENIDTAIASIWGKFKEGGVDSIDYISQDLNGMAYQLSGMTNDQLPEVMKGVLRQYIADQQAVIDQAAYAASPKGMLDSYLASGGGDDRAESRKTQLEAQQYAYSVATGSDLAQTSNAKGEKLKPSEITSQMKTDLAQISKDSGTVGTNMDKIKLNVKEASTYAQTMKEALDTMKSVIPVTFKFTADDPQGLIGMVRALQGGASLGDIVKDNGGKVPGASNGSGGRARADRG